ncbi:DUF4238 domain-containing protein [Clostridiales bacterium FE2010]|nr:DUF4238 domain-containing protein [Clostridiales bacterium FE2010]
MRPGKVNSHIQMPRFLLARFENEYHSFFYYDVEKRFIGTNGHAKSINTEHGYYPDEIEKLLSDEIEKPFSQILKFIDSLNLEKPFFTMTSIDEGNIKQFLVSLIVRGPLFIDGINRNSVFFQFFSPTDQRTLAISQGLMEAEKQKVFDSFRVTFTVNNTDKSFVLPIGGLYSYSLNGYAHISLPVSPKMAITLIENAGIPSLEQEGITRMYLIAEDKHVISLNSFAFQQQCKRGYGYVISPSRDALEEILPMRER